MNANFSTLITDYFVSHLANVRNMSRHTVMAYRDALKMLLCFAAHLQNHTVDRVRLEDLTGEVVLEFLSHLEAARRNSVRTRNARLAAIHSFFRYILSREPVFASLCQRVLAIPFKKTTRRVLGYLSEEETKHLLSQVDRSRPHGERDYLLLALLYDTGARVQELLDLKPTDFRLESPAFVRLTGKGRRERLCPLLPQTARLVGNYFSEQGRSPGDNGSFLLNRSGQKLSRHGVRYLLKKYLAGVQQKIPSLSRQGISPHTLRHTKAMHLLQAGLPLITIKDILGHADVKSTEVYVQVDLEMKQKALECVGTPSQIKKSRRPIGSELLSWLESL
jgi:integrase/recombinase XerD